MSDYLTVREQLRLATLAVVALGCAGVPPTPSPMPTATSTVAPAATPRRTATPTPAAAFIALPAEDQPVAPGTYVLANLGFHYRLTVSGHGWYSLAPDWGVIKGDNAASALLALWEDPPFVYLNPCHWADTESDTGSTPADWVEALGQVEELNPSEPTDVVVGGHAGKRITITVAEDVDPNECMEGQYRPYWGRIHIGPTQIDDIWVISLPGNRRRVIVTSYFPDTPVQLRDELEQMLALMTIDPE